MSKGASWLAAVVVLLVPGGCLPYAAGGTAQPVPPGQRTEGFSLYAIPGGVENHIDSTSINLISADPEVRWGITEGTDVGVRLPSFSGFVVTLKRRFGSDGDTARAAVAIEPGIGIVNFGEHALVQLSLFASAKQRATLTPYGGLRVMQVAPIGRYAVADSPTSGGFFGVRFGTTDYGVSPELAIYYDRSALEIRTRSVIFVPSVTLHGREVMRFLGIGR